MGVTVEVKGTALRVDAQYEEIQGMARSLYQCQHVESVDHPSNARKVTDIPDQVVNGKTYHSGKGNACAEVQCAQRLFLGLSIYVPHHC